MSLPHRCAESDPGSRADADWCRSVHDLFKNTRSGWPTRSCTPVRSRKRGAPNFDSQLNTITPLLSLALIGSASGRFWGERDLESEAFSMRRLGGSRWCLRRTRCAMGFERQLVAESITGRAVANWNGVVVIVERIAGASRGVHGPGCGNVSPWGRHTNALACRSTSPGR